MGGAVRVRRAAQSLAALGRMTDSSTRVEHCARNLDGELQALQAWYTALGSALVKRRQVPPHTSPTPPAAAGCSRASATPRAAATKRRSTPLWCCSGRVSILTISGASRHTSPSAPAPHGQLQAQRNRLDTRAAREARTCGRAIARRPREVRDMAATCARIGFVGLGHMGGNMAARSSPPAIRSTGRSEAASTPKT